MPIPARMIWRVHAKEALRRASRSLIHSIMNNGSANDFLHSCRYVLFKKPVFPPQHCNGDFQPSCGVLHAATFCFQVFCFEILIGRQEDEKAQMLSRSRGPSGSQSNSITKQAAARKSIYYMDVIQVSPEHSNSSEKVIESR